MAMARDTGTTTAAMAGGIMADTRPLITGVRITVGMLPPTTVIDIVECTARPMPTILDHDTTGAMDGIGTTIVTGEGGEPSCLRN